MRCGTSPATRRATPAVAAALVGGAPRPTPSMPWTTARRAARGVSVSRRSWASTATALSCMDLSSPTWLEEPAFAVENLRRYLTVDAADPEGQRERLLGDGQELVRAARERIADDPGLLAAFDHAYETALAAWPLEEDHAFYIDQRSLAGATRRAFLRLATNLAGRGRIPNRDDIWYLDFDALRDGIAGDDLAARAQASRRRYAEDSLLDAPPLLGMPPDPHAPADPGLVKFFGKPGPPDWTARCCAGLPGRVAAWKGIARVVRSVDDLHLVQPGEILVCRSTTPPWTPVFASIAALVTDTGGVLAHGAIVAREYAIPAVMGTKIATAVIRTASGSRSTATPAKCSSREAVTTPASVPGTWTRWARAAAGLCTAAALVPLNSTMIAVALLDIERDLGVSVSAVTWLVSGYLVVMALAQPMGGRIGDALGHRRTFLAGSGAFLRRPRSPRSRPGSPRSSCCACRRRSSGG